MSPKARDPISCIARRYGIHARGFEALFLAVRKIDAVIAQAHADLQALHDQACTLDAMLFDAASKLVKPHHPNGANQPTAATNESATPLNLVMPEIEREIDAGQKINAIKLYREATGLSLKESKIAVERICDERGRPNSTRH